MITSLTGEPEDRNELVTAIFGLITARLEDAAGLAISGQNRKMLRAEIVDIANQITSFNEDVSILLRAAIAVLPSH